MALLAEPQSLPAGGAASGSGFEKAFHRDAAVVLVHVAAVNIMLEGHFTRSGLVSSTVPGARASSVGIIRIEHPDRRHTGNKGHRACQIAEHPEIIHRGGDGRETGVGQSPLIGVRGEIQNANRSQEVFRHHAGGTEFPITLHARLRRGLR